MSTTDHIHAVRHAGTLRLDVRYKGREPEPLPDRGFRQRYWYRITDTSNPGREPVEGSDLRSGVGDHPDVGAMIRTLATFLGAAGEAYWYTMQHPSTPSDNRGLFSSWVPEAAYENSDELALLTEEPDPNESPTDLDHGLGPGSRPQVARTELIERWEEISEPEDDPELGFMVATEIDEPPPAWPPARYFEIVFMQDSEGYDLCDMITAHGVDVAIEHLAQWDYGDETVNAAISNGDVQEDVVTFHGDRTAVSGPYTLVYNLSLGHASLLKEFAAVDRPAADVRRRNMHGPAIPPPNASDRGSRPPGPAL
ncbi:hypothetical protein ACFS27_22635 [Promicromonospora vindobonensis]|uniref:Uncharacterized protein n=1 Tax=Promicromonospora vindobonensis TaxID=195748 RepID=A0ABW5W1C7_9MICO